MVQSCYAKRWLRGTESGYGNEYRRKEGEEHQIRDVLTKLAKLVQVNKR